MVPSSVANRNVAGLPSGPGKGKAPELAKELKTMPVGAAVETLGSGGAMATGGIRFSVTLLPLTLSMLAKPEPFSLIQNGLVGLYATPHGLIRFGSVATAGPASGEPSEIRFVCANVVGAT